MKFDLEGLAIDKQIPTGLIRCLWKAHAMPGRNQVGCDHLFSDIALEIVRCTFNGCVGAPHYFLSEKGEVETAFDLFDA
ncbi:hypothetical protein D9M71_726530 [compost metagenome]